MSRDKIVPAHDGLSEYTEKRSTFIGAVHRVSSEAEARDFIASVKKQHRDARHNCWCFIVSGGVERYSDDGEPQGTAGLPMLEVFRREGVSDVVCVVTRYFGGILLGAGGLLRAYTKAAKDALDAAGKEAVIPRATLTLRCPYSLADRLKLETASLGGRVEDVSYADVITLTVSLPASDAELYISRIFDMTSGTVLPERTEC